MSLWEKITRSPSYRPAQIAIHPEHTDVSDRLVKPFKRNEQYFLVRINEMYLSYRRKWFSEYDPMVFVLSEFLYGGEKVAVPYVVGPSMLTEKIEKIPEGMILKDTTVAGLHPFRGGEFAISVVLARLRQQDYLRKILKLIESTAGTYTSGFVTMISQYSKVAKVVLDGIDSLLDTQDVEPLIGFRKPYQPDVDNFVPTYFVLINKDEQEVNENNFYVKNNSLLYGDSIDKAKPYRKDDYVLYSIRDAVIRSDYESLPFHKQWLELVKTIGDLHSINDDEKQIINAKLFSLQSVLETSPDLTQPQVDELINGYLAERDKMMARRTNRLSGSAESRPEETQPEDEWKKKMKDLSLRILKSR
ncbi:MAG TPA: hypothetical protein VFW11_07780 [Cyclobacteriaceae bacterium]|nr:hypothetical protein [Cyclobacteriaceae bacterium]